MRPTRIIGSIVRNALRIGTTGAAHLLAGVCLCVGFGTGSGAYLTTVCTGYAILAYTRRAGVIFRKILPLGLFQPKLIIIWVSVVVNDPLDGFLGRRQISCNAQRVFSVLLEVKIRVPALSAETGRVQHEIHLLGLPHVFFFTRRGATQSKTIVGPTAGGVRAKIRGIAKIRSVRILQ